MDLVPLLQSALTQKTAHTLRAARFSPSPPPLRPAPTFLFLLFLVARVAWFSIQAGRVEAWLKSNETEVAGIKATASRWNALSPAIDPDVYPVELLLRCSNPLPQDGSVHFTLFSAGVGTILIQGESSNSKAMFKFADDLKKSPELREYKFETPLPASGTTKFRFTGARYGANAH